MSLPDLPEAEDQDSEDLTDEEISISFVVSSVDAMIAFLQDLTCDEGHKFVPSAHSLRKRKPHYYHRIDLVCAEGTHTGRVTFRADWLQPGEPRNS